MRAKRAGKFFKLIELSRAKRVENFWTILHFSSKFYQVKVRLFIFFPEEYKLFIFSIFKVRLFISKKSQPPPPQNKMVVPLAKQSGPNNNFNFRSVFRGFSFKQKF